MFLLSLWPLKDEPYILRGSSRVRSPEPSRQSLELPTFFRASNSCDPQEV